MRLTRRGWLAAGLSLGAASTSLARSAPEAGFEVLAGQNRYGPALEALAGYARAELAAWGLPGMTLCVADREGFVAVLGLGWADVAAGVPVRVDHRFQIGSISKSFVSLALLTLADRGRLDLDAPIAPMLPDLPLPAAPITSAQLLGHVAGLPDSAPLFARSEGRLWCGFPPGARFSYSNTGFVILGRLLERLTGSTHHEAVGRLVRAPLGLSSMAGVIAPARRAEFARGYWPVRSDTASPLPGDPLELAYWTPEDTPAGSIGATAPEMARYLRLLLTLGAGEGGGLLSPAMARRFCAPGAPPAPDFGPGARYGLGVAIVPLDGAPALHHTGGMMSFSSSFHADPAAGVACFASVNARNGGYRPRLATAFAVRLLRANRAGTALPAAPDPLASLRLARGDRFAGAWKGPDGGFDIVLDGAGARLLAGGLSGRLVAEGPNRLLTDHPRFAAHGFDLAAGQPSGLWWGERLYGRGTPLATPAPAPALLPLAGDYLNRDPWVGGLRLRVRGDALVVEGLGPVRDRGVWWSAANDPGGLERLRFDAPVAGRPSRLAASGADLSRLEV